MVQSWPTTKISTTSQVFETLLELRAKRWICRGQPKQFLNLIPGIDREILLFLQRVKKLKLESESITRIRSAAHWLQSGEEIAKFDDIGALMVLQHYGVRTRMLDWTRSPEVAAFFAAAKDDAFDGEVWCFDYDQYAVVGKRQWKRWPQCTHNQTGTDTDFDAKLTAFNLSDPPPWIVVADYPKSFPRQIAQRGAYTLMGALGIDHALALFELLGDPKYFHRYIIPAALKPSVTQSLQARGTNFSTLFPDSSGAARFAGEVFSSFS